jgi:hypothetical protein
MRKVYIVFSLEQAANRSHNRSTVSYDLKEKQSLNRKFDDARIEKI